MSEMGDYLLKSKAFYKLGFALNIVIYEEDSFAIGK
jgi:hypothetical protein